MYKVYDLIFETREMASDFLDTLELIVSEYRLLRVNRVYSLLKISPAPIDNEYGWRDLTEAKIKPRGKFYVLVLPKPILLD